MEEVKMPMKSKQKLMSSGWGMSLLMTPILLTAWIAFYPALTRGYELWQASSTPVRQMFGLLMGVVVIVVWRMRVTLHQLRHHAAFRSSGAVAASTASLDMTTPRKADLLEHSARHEAAHMVVAMALGNTPVSVDICQVEGRGGQYHARHPEGWTMPERALVCMVSLLAGQIINHRDGNPDGGACSDIEAVMRQAAIIISIGETPSGHMGALNFDDLLDTARNLSTAVIEMNEPAICDLAQRLVDTQGHGSLYAEDLNDLQVVPYPLTHGRAPTHSSGRG